MFNYLKFLRYLNIEKFISSVEQWLADVASINTKSLYNSEQDFKDFRSLVLMSLFKIFIENEVNLDTLEIKTSSTNYNSDILELILKNQNFIHNVKNLKLHIDDNNDSQSGSDDILHYIKEHIMKEKRVKYLAIKNFRTSKELFNLKDEVKEFDIHNIKNYELKLDWIYPLCPKSNSPFLEIGQ
ncbi:hypothetical protein GLOIN_2v1772600 [Rhizophagus irregularis DAOM 181602=DAOM 197198]|nr:hypothetical protein GLOIN_2v1772600 [Rhizophagus irregularis DAOM 181602=DAOM 197198]